MISIVVSREVRAPASELWDLLVDWPRHAAWVPFTTMSVDAAGGHGVGSTFVGRTAIGRVGFDDVMRVTDWRPPSGQRVGVVRIAHEGNVVGGTADIEVRPVTTTRCVVAWREDVELLPRLPRRAARVVGVLAGPPTVLAGRVIFGRVLRRAADQAEQAHEISQDEGR